MKLIKKILLALAILPAMSINAQTAIEEQNVLDNTYIGAEIGASTPLSFNSVFPLNFQAGIKVGKNFSPVFGLNFEGIAMFGSASDNQSRFSYHNIVRGINVGLNGTVDMFNLCAGYNPNRVFTLIPEIGIGWFHGFNNGADFDDLSAKTGIQAAFNVKEAWQLYVEPTVFWDLTKNSNNVQFNKNCAQLAIQVGFIYKFKTSNGTHNFKQYDIAAMNEEINSLRSELAKKPTEVVKEVPYEVVKEVIVTNNVSDVVIMFAQNSYDLTEEAIEELKKVTGTVQVYGYASPEGTKLYNLNLSQKRADAVAKYLISNGVNVTKCIGHGVNGNTSNRVVIVKH